MCQQAGREWCTAHSSEHSAPVGNRVLVTGVDPCKGRRRVREPRSPRMAWKQLDFCRASSQKGRVAPMCKTKCNTHFSISWPGTQRGWSKPTILLSKGITNFSKPCPCPPVCSSHPDTIQQRNHSIKRLTKGTSQWEKGTVDSESPHSLLPVLVKRPRALLS